MLAGFHIAGGSEEDGDDMLAVVSTRLGAGQLTARPQDSRRGTGGRGVVAPALEATAAAREEGEAPQGNQVVADRSREIELVVLGGRRPSAEHTQEMRPGLGGAVETANAPNAPNAADAPGAPNSPSAQQATSVTLELDAFLPTGLVLGGSRSGMGPVVRAVHRRTQAASLGVEPGWVVVEVRGKRIASERQFEGAVTRMRASRSCACLRLRTDHPPPVR